MVTYAVSTDPLSGWWAFDGCAPPLGVGSTVRCEPTSSLRTRLGAPRLSTPHPLPPDQRTCVVRRCNVSDINKRGSGVVVVVIALLAVACGGSSYGTSTTASLAGSSAASGSLRVEQMDFRFQPQTLSAGAGKAATIVLVNSGSVTHTFTIDELGVDKSVAPGQTATVSFTPTKGGDLTFYCRFHRGSGMTGTLRVSGAASVAPAKATPSSSGGGSSGSYGY
jgi:plastocyanin